MLICRQLSRPCCIKNSEATTILTGRVYQVPDSFILGEELTSHDIKVNGHMQVPSQFNIDGKFINEYASGALGWESGMLVFALRSKGSDHLLLLRLSPWEKGGVTTGRAEIGGDFYSTVHCTFAQR